METTALVWFRQDLRLADNPALQRALILPGKIIPLYIWSADEEGGWSAGGATKWWLHHSLASLDGQLRQLGSRLTLRVGDALSELDRLLQETQASHVFWNRRYEPLAIKQEERLAAHLTRCGISHQSFNSALLFSPSEIQTRDGSPFRVFTPFWKACLNRPQPDERLDEALSMETIISEKAWHHPQTWPQSAPLEDLKLLPQLNSQTGDWTAGLQARWTPGEPAGQRQLQRLLDSVLTSYDSQRDMPGESATSFMSPYLHFGEISPGQIWHAVKAKLATRGGAAVAGRPPLKSAAHTTFGAQLKTSAAVYLQELGWREFAYHLLYHFPDTIEHPLYPQFEKFPWRQDDDALQRWQKGQTGYPLVDAGMRELWQTGFMHNRVRMIAASFLVKDLLLPWLDGAKWFWDTLVDADLANNTLGWQWTAGCGADAAPYFRIFNPSLQGKKFDPEGKYVRQWLPELAKLQGATIHEPWKVSAQELAKAGIELGKSYPYPIVDHKAARERALNALKSVKKTAAKNQRKKHV